MIVEVVEGVAKISVHHTLLQLGNSCNKHEVSDRWLIATTEPLLGLELIVDSLEVLFEQVRDECVLLGRHLNSAIDGTSERFGHGKCVGAQEEDPLVNGGLFKWA